MAEMNTESSDLLRTNGGDATTPATVVSQQQQLQQQHLSGQRVTIRLPGLRQMTEQMTPDTAKVKCRNFLATLLRLANDQPDTVLWLTLLELETLYR